jgi:hypothetical protein
MQTAIHDNCTRLAASLATLSTGMHGAEQNQHDEVIRMQSHYCCETCGKVAAFMPQCQRCFTSRCCSRECQSAAWASHKERCKQTKVTQGTEKIEHQFLQKIAHSCTLFDILQVRNAHALLDRDEADMSSVPTTSLCPFDIWCVRAVRPRDADVPVSRATARSLSVKCAPGIRNLLCCVPGNTIIIR